MAIWIISNFLLLMMPPWITLYVYVGSYLWEYIFWKIPRNGIAGLKVDAHVIFSDIVKSHPSYKGCTVLPSLQQCLRMPISLVSAYYTLIMKHFIEVPKWFQIHLLVLRVSWRLSGCLKPLVN